MINVLSVASEIYPLIKTGGLADVTGALPGALAAHDIRVRTLVPGYPAVLGALTDRDVLVELPDFFGGYGRLVTGSASGLDLIVIEAPHLYDRPGNPYVGPDSVDWPDNYRRFAALGYAAYELARGIAGEYRPAIVHCHDWQAALAPAYLAFNAPTRARSLLTVHNIAFQGRFGWDIFNELRLDFRAASEGAIEYYGGIGFLKAGLQTADAVTTVSPTYALEIKTPEFGMGLEGLLQSRAPSVHGILNGIDTTAWNPQTDAALPSRYGHRSTEDRADNRRALEQRFGLDDTPGPLFSVVSRLTWQKGIDLLVGVIDEMVAAGGKLAVLGSGDAELENALAGAALRHVGKVGFVRAYDEGLSHLIQGGADVMMVPSRFEPCGLTQLYGLRYGCVPLVSRVGGLADTVIDANEAAVEAGVGTGIVFAPVTREALADAVQRAIRLYARPKVWRKMQRRGMKTDVSWDLSAEKYARLYRELAGVGDEQHEH